MPAPTPADDLHADLLTLVCRIKNADPAALRGGGDFAAELGFDSVDLVELAVQLDREYGIDLGAQPGDLESLTSLDGLLVLVRERRTR